MDFAMLPPEVNSGRMYAGPGSGPMLAAAVAWDGLAAELYSAAAAYESVISGLAAGWRGPSSALMAAAAAPYVAWMSATATQAERTAAQARAAVAAYEAAVAATVPPPLIAANRSLLMTLVATNFFGQNTAAIAATEAQYAEMWAQDAAAMYGYAGSAAQASALTPWVPPQHNTDPRGVTGQAATVGRAAATSAGTAQSTVSSVSHALSALPQTLHSLARPASAAAADPPAPTTLLTLASYSIGAFNPMHLYSPFGAYYDTGVQTFLAPFNNYNMQMAYADALGRAGLAVGGVSPGTPLVGSAGGAVSAGMGRAGVVGSLSVPQGWASAAPAIRPVAAALPHSGLGAVSAVVAADGQGSLVSDMALSGLAGRAMAGSGGSVARFIGAGGGAVSGGATTATIIVIPED
ncbi:PPE family protein [Mycobacterium sp. SM1]|uniref:PPE family protein n=1 Tax=Mycobacterium sp. SM1 TaxID=2816243 RepID=UPI001BCD1AF2|nr:PPE family protein [Mycobacterium sp. SM1]MBS4729193.1 PPE family protein [Mycobacterium sp. SM1]